MTYKSTATCRGIVLSKPEHADLSDPDLIAVARGEADRIGLDLGDDLIITGMWV